MKKVFVIILALVLWLLLNCNVRANEIHDAINKNNIKKVRKLLGKNPRLANTREKIAGMTPLHIASARGYYKIAMLLISKGSDVNSQDAAWGFTPLHLAKTKKVAIVLIANGAYIEARDKYGGTPLFAAVTNRHKDVVSYLLSKGADVNSKTSYEMTPLKKSIKCNYPEITIILKKFGAK